MRLSSERIRELRDLAGAGNLRTASADCWAYGYDNSRLHRPPEAVVFAADHEQIRRIVRWCHDHRIPITPRGRGTGTTGAAVPIEGGIPGSTRTNRSSGRNSKIRSMRSIDNTIPPSMGTAAPVVPVPRPRGVMGMR
jgi:UDP-N-acetylenolpyruvoylglucosamine reductase